ncbi:hypothetical protein NDU88_008214 [Pleurodeles waltl]|uniref:Uncharacterized protein n=1 Tax=Pleurodeles waltl TaxID=8319 RepID=A0AAV7RT54_PLEWA|nr:hypothetical protein NDU88_008214 [Pleurodeles waltl]
MERDQEKNFKQTRARGDYRIHGIQLTDQVLEAYSKNPGTRLNVHAHWLLGYDATLSNARTALLAQETVARRRNATLSNARDALPAQGTVARKQDA